MGVYIPDLHEVEIYFCQCGMKFYSDVGISNHEERSGHSMDCDRSPTDEEREKAREILIERAKVRR